MYTLSYYSFLFAGAIKRQGSDYFSGTYCCKKTKRLFDACALLSFSSLIILDNLIIFIYPLMALVTANIKIDLKHYLILFMTPLIILPSAYVLLSFLSLDSYLFSSYFFADQLQATDEYNFIPNSSRFFLTLLLEDTFNLTYSYVPIFIVFVLFVISVIIKFLRTYGTRRRILDGVITSPLHASS